MASTGGSVEPTEASAGIAEGMPGSNIVFLHLMAFEEGIHANRKPLTFAIFGLLHKHSHSAKIRRAPVVQLC